MSRGARLIEGGLWAAAALVFLWGLVERCAPAGADGEETLRPMRSAYLGAQSPPRVFNEGGLEFTVRRREADDGAGPPAAVVSVRNPGAGEASAVLYFLLQEDQDRSRMTRVALPRQILGGQEVRFTLCPGERQERLILLAAPEAKLLGPTPSLDDSRARARFLAALRDQLAKQENTGAAPPAELLAPQPGYRIQIAWGPQAGEYFRQELPAAAAAAPGAPAAPAPPTPAPVRPAPPVFPTAAAAPREPDTL